jgi:TrpR-related protein YerC/YecD
MFYVKLRMILVGFRTCGLRAIVITYYHMKTEAESLKIAAKIQELFDAVSQLKSATECQIFLQDLCTPAELLAMADRWEVAKLLSQGNLPYRKIYEQTGTSTATVTRVARALSEGAGYQFLLKRTEKNRLKKAPERDSLKKKLRNNVINKKTDSLAVGEKKTTKKQERKTS